MKRVLILSVALAAGVGAGLVLSQLVAGEQRQPLRMAHWKNIYRKPAGLVAGADLIVVARHTGAELSRFVGEGEDATPFTNNRFAIDSVLRGEHHGDELVVEQTGGVLDDGVVFAINDGGPYSPGASYLLFLKSVGDGTYYLINHQARYEIRDGVLEGVDPTDRVVAQFHGRSLESGEQLVHSRARMIE